MVSIPVSLALAPLPALSCCRGDGGLSFAVGGHGAVRGRAALVLVFELKGVAAGGRGRRGGGRRGRG